MESYSTEQSEKIYNFIPIGRHWDAESNTQCSLSDPKIRITVSSTYKNEESFHPKWLANGKKEGAGQIGWASDNTNNQFIIVSLNKAVSANAISILPRTQAFNQSPTHFEIWGSNDSFEYKLLATFTEENWTSQEKHFIFHNDDEYCHYKIFLNSSNSTVFGISGLNIGRIEN